MNLPQFGRLEAKDIHKLKEQSEELEPEDNTVLQEKGDEIKGLYFIVEGAILEEYPDKHTEFHDTGELLNLGSLLLKKPALTKLTAKHKAILRVFKKDAMLEELEYKNEPGREDNIKFKHDLIKSSVSNLRIIYENKCEGLRGKTKNEITEFMLTTSVHKFKKGEHSMQKEDKCSHDKTEHEGEDTHTLLGNLDNGGFLFEGSLKITDA